MRTKQFFPPLLKEYTLNICFEVSWKNQETNQPNVLWVSLFLKKNFTLLLLKFIYHNFVYISLGSVLKGGKQVMKY